MNRTKWDNDYLDLAQWWADRRSKDPSTKVGAVIVNAHNEVLSLGYNGLTPGVCDSAEILNDRAKKYTFVAHAERNALDLAKGDVAGATIYVSPLPICHECAKSIAQRRLRRVVIRADQLDNERWRESWQAARHIMECRGVQIDIHGA